MAYISFQPNDFFSTTLYTGTGSTQTISGVGFEPNFTWVKDRDATEAPTLFDSVRGATKRLYSSSTADESTSAVSLTAWNSDGFAIGSGGEVNTSGDDFVSWNWKSNTTSGLSGGTITPTAYSINATTGVGIYRYNGTGSAGTIAHGLGVAPDIVICKSLIHSGLNWAVYTSSAANPTTETLYLNADNSIGGSSTFWNSTSPTSTLFSLGTGDDVNGSSKQYIMYAFAKKQGFSHLGSFFGSGRTHGTFVYCGLKPSLIFIKAITNSGGWYMYDAKRGYNGARQYLQANATSAGDTNEGNFGIDLNANGFKIHGTNNGINNHNETYQVIAFAEEAIVSSNGKAATAR